MKVILAEKPSVARDLAAFLKARSRKDGYFEGSGYQISWALGHLVTLKDPDDYDPALKRWTLDSLPFIPAKFGLKLRDDARTKQQFAVIKRLFHAADTIICATDAGREGELIFRYILTLCRCANKPAQRLWLNSLTPQAIGSAFRSIRPLSDYDDLYAAAKCRSEADWIVGLNATRNYTVRYGSTGILWSLGRVQTPVLAMIVDRDDQISTFKPEPFWELLTKYREVTFRFSGDRFKRETDAQATLGLTQSHPLVISAIKRKPEKSLPPQLYDLTELQRDMNRRYGISAAETLKIAQSLYESKLITYPRTDSRYLTKDMQTEVPGILEKLKSMKRSEIEQLDLRSLSFSGRIVNDQKVSDHHAIIPTGSVGSIAGREQQVFDAIVVRFIAAFYPAHTKEVTTIEAVSNKVPFHARGVRDVDLGWTLLYPRKAKSKTDEDQQSLPKFSKGESGPHKPFVKKGETSPPKPFTENTLLGAMDTAGKMVDEAELREALKEKGLGTPATRASIIETLLNRKYIGRDKKNLVANDLGRYLIALIRDHNMKSPELTGEWEAKLKRIEAGQFSAATFMREIVDYIHQIVDVSGDDAIDSSCLGKCPKCGENVIAGKRAYGCSAWRTGCSFVLEPVYKDVTLDKQQIQSLLQHGVLSEPIEVASVKALLYLRDTGALIEAPVPDGNEQSKDASSRRTPANERSGKTDASGKPANKTTSAAEIGVCPLCGSSIVEQTKSYSCCRWRDGCKFTIWKTMASKRITVSVAKTLLRQGKTKVLKGFKSKAGTSFSAKLVLKDGKVSFEFEGPRA